MLTLTDSHFEYEIDEEENSLFIGPVSCMKPAENKDYILSISLSDLSKDERYLVSQSFEKLTYAQARLKLVYERYSNLHFTGSKNLPN